MIEEKTLKLDEVTIDNSLNPRDGALDQDVVMEYAMHYQELPPMHVFTVAGAGYLLVAGFHRIAAHRLAGAREGRFIVHQGTRLDAAEYADLDNLKHGLRLTRAEKRQVIERQLKRHPDWSDVRIATVCTTTDKTVRSVREELEARSEIPTLDVLVGADGISRPRTVARQQPKVFTDEFGNRAVEVTDGDVAAGMAALFSDDEPAEPETDDDLAGPDPDAELEIEAEAGQDADAQDEEQDEAEPEGVCARCIGSGVCQTCKGTGMAADGHGYCPECGPSGATGECPACQARALEITREEVVELDLDVADPDQPEPAAEAQTADLLARMKAHQPAPKAAPTAQPLQMAKPAPAPQALQMTKAEPDTIITITLKPTGLALISVQADGRPPRLLSAHRESLLEKLQELLAPVPEAEGQAEEWLTISN